MQWIFANNPERGFLVDGLQEPRMDGIDKLSLHIVGSYRVADPNTVHTKIFDHNEKAILHEVFRSTLEAQFFILKTVLSQPAT